MTKITKRLLNSFKLLLHNPSNSIPQMRGISSGNLPIMTIGVLIITFCFGKMALATWVGASVVKQIPKDILPVDLPPGMTVLADNITFWLTDGFLNSSYIGVFTGMLIVGPYFYLTMYKDKKLRLNLLEMFCWVYYFSLIFSFFFSIISTIFLNIAILLKSFDILSADTIYKGILAIAIAPTYATYIAVFILSLLIIKHSSNTNVFYVGGLFFTSIFSYFTLPCIFLPKIKKIFTFIIDLFVYIYGFAMAIIIFLPYKLLDTQWSKRVKEAT